MKKFIGLFLSILLIFPFAACNEKKDGFSQDDLAIKYNNVTYKVNEKAYNVKKALGEPDNTISQYSCHYSDNGDEYWFDYYFGDDTYDPNDESCSDVLRVHTVPLKKDTDYICDFECYTSKITTTKGITVGSTLEEVTQAYGNNYVDEGAGYYTYYAGEVLPETPKLMFYIPDNTVKFFSVSASINF